MKIALKVFHVLGVNCLSLPVHSLGLEKRTAEKTTKDLQRLKVALVGHLVMVHCVVVAGVGVAVPGVLVYELAEMIFAWIFLTAHEKHMLNEMGYALSALRIVARASGDSHSRRRLSSARISDKKAFNAIIQLNVSVFSVIVLLPQNLTIQLHPLQFFYNMQEEIKRLNKDQVQQLMKLNPNHFPQAYEDLPLAKVELPQIISRQATVNIGTIGHVAHGKSTVVKAISGVHTIRFKQQKVRNITIRLGYANAKIYKCNKCTGYDAYKSFSSSKEDKVKCSNKDCTGDLQLVRHVSFVDCPGHDILLSTMLTGAAVMDSAFLLIAANMECPQPQTSQHLVAVQIMKLDNIIILQNKVDLVSNTPAKIKQNYNEIKAFIKDTRCSKSPIIPISAIFKYNIDLICKTIVQTIPIPARKLDVPPLMIIIRSFDVNLPSTPIASLKGGVVGGSIIQGVLQVGDVIEIRPGESKKDQKGQLICKPIRSRVITLQAEDNHLLYAVPGGLIGVGLLIDPSFTRNDKLVGNVLGIPGSLPDIYDQLTVKFYQLKRLLGASKQGKQKQKINRVQLNQVLKLNVGSTMTPGKIVQIKEEILRVQLIQPVCMKIGDKAAFSRRIEKKYRLIGWGQIKDGRKLKFPEGK